MTGWSVRGQSVEIGGGQIVDIDRSGFNLSEIIYSVRRQELLVKILSLVDKKRATFLLVTPFIVNLVEVCMLTPKDIVYIFEPLLFLYLLDYSTSSSS